MYVQYSSPKENFLYTSVTIKLYEKYLSNIHLTK